MLVISRKEHEAVVLQLPNGEEIDIIVTGLKGKQVKLAFEMPDDVNLLREELFEDDDES